MESVASGATRQSTGGEPVLVDPRAPRFGQSVTAIGLAAGVALQEPLLVVAVAVVLNAALLSGWRLDLYAFLWRTLLIPVVGAPAEREPASPHRFARLMGAVFTAVATAFLLVDVTVAPPEAALGLSIPALAGYALTAMVAGLAALAATTGICVGCRMYRQVAFFRNLGVV